MNDIIATALHDVRHRIERARAQSPSAAKVVELIAVSKTKPVEALRHALLAGQRHFGENRVQEAAEKWPALKAGYPDCVLHLIGPLQTNKLKQALSLFDVIHTLDREKLADALTAEKAKGTPIPPCFIQVNTGEEPQKAGVNPAETPAFLHYCRDRGLPVTGLMCIPPVDQPPGPHFALLHKIARENGLENLSMGMSGDYEEAVMLGATHIRVGSAIFGERG